MYNLKPLGQRVIVKRIAKDEKKGLIVPDTAKKVSLVGQVIHCGPEADWVTVGDYVLFAKFSGFELPIDRDYITDKYNDCLVMNCEDILTTLEMSKEESHAELANA